MPQRFSTATCLVVLLLLLNPLGLMTRRLGAAEYSWVGPLPDVPSLVCLPEGGESCGSWMTLLERLPACHPSTRARTLLREAAVACDGIGGTYVTLLDTLDATQRQALLRAQPDLVDPFFPGINGDTHPLIDYCASALSVGGVEALPLEPSLAARSWPRQALPMPQELFWGLTRLAQGIDGRLAPEQRSHLLGGLQALATATMQYQRLRVALWYELRLEPLEPRFQLFAFPASQELLAVRRAAGVPDAKGGEGTPAPGATPPPPPPPPPPALKGGGSR